MLKICNYCIIIRVVIYLFSFSRPVTKHQPMNINLNMMSSILSTFALRPLRQSTEDRKRKTVLSVWQNIKRITKIVYARSAQLPVWANPCKDWKSDERFVKCCWSMFYLYTICLLEIFGFSGVVILKIHWFKQFICRSLLSWEIRLSVDI